MLDYYTYDLCGDFAPVFARFFMGAGQEKVRKPDFMRDVRKRSEARDALFSKPLPLQNPVAGRMRRTQDVKGGFLR